ncbi:MAG: winged helix-turn-helix domain-containing protein, partial [Deltaproteobacteria bacterium]|nr:winged helix-turn-helix domain-containing protein [Deltaproteobacteria bacterium]
MFERGEKRKAATELTNVRRIGRSMKSHLVEYMCLLAEARFALETGKDSVGLKALKKALLLGQTHKVGYYYFFQPDVMVRLYLRALDEGMEVEYVQKMIRKYDLVLDPPPIDCERWPWPIKVFTMGRFALVKNGIPVRSGRKAQQKPLDLLKALLAFGGREVSEERLADALWPEADGDAGRQALSITIHRLRQLLGVEKAVTRFDGCVTLDQRYCWVDVWAFERALGRAKGLFGKDKKGALRLAMRIAGMYKGHFLAEEVDEPWVILHREHLRNKFLRHMERFGKAMEKRGEYEKAVECYRKGVEADPIAEGLCQRLMLCLQALGRNAEGITVYNKLERVLLSSLHVTPSPKSVKILEEIKA